MTGPSVAAPDPEALATLGLVWEGEIPDQNVEVWPENWQALQVFLAMATQWRIGIGINGMLWLGLDYNALPVVEDRLELPVAERADVFSRLRVLEAVARRALNEER